MENTIQSSSDLIVYQSNRLCLCAQCGSSIGRSQHTVLLPPKNSPHCLRCLGLDDLVFLPSGNTALTRRAKANSSRHAEVLKYSSRRKRNERQGLLVEEEAIKKAEEQNKADSEQREKARAAASVRRIAQESEYRQSFTETILELYPKCPPNEAAMIAHHACEKYSGRVGRSSAAKALADGAIALAVEAHVRHCHTDYDRLLNMYEKEDARKLVRENIDFFMAEWRSESVETAENL